MKNEKILYDHDILVQGAQLLANQHAVVVHDLEKKRVDCIKTKEKLQRDQDNNVKAFKVTFVNYNQIY